MLYAEWNLDEYVAVQRREAAEDAATQAERKKAITTAQKAIEMGLSPEQAAKLADLPVDEIMALV